MIVDQHLEPKRKLYEPNTSGFCVNVYIILEITEEFVSIVPYEGYRENRGRGQAGFNIAKDYLLAKDRMMFVSEEEAVHALMDMIEDNLLKNLGERYEFDLLPIPRGQEVIG